MYVNLQGCFSPQNWLTNDPTLYPVNYLQNDLVNSAPDRPGRWDPYMWLILDLIPLLIVIYTTKLKSLYSSSPFPPRYNDFPLVSYTSG